VLISELLTIGQVGLHPTTELPHHHQQSTHRSRRVTSGQQPLSEGLDMRTHPSRLATRRS
jgi:hypothetical protein